MQKDATGEMGRKSDSGHGQQERQLRYSEDRDRDRDARMEIERGRLQNTAVLDGRMSWARNANRQKQEKTKSEKRTRHGKERREIE